jgi:hypothetical protein
MQVVSERGESLAVGEAGMSYITKDQFGVELYEAIKTCAEVEQIQLQQTRATAKHQPYEATRLEKLYLSKKAEAVKLVTDCPCSDADAASLVKRFPWVLK